jgi:hypothetical protein
VLTPGARDRSKHRAGLAMNGAFERSPRIIFANTVNELMLTTPTLAHSTGLFAASPRKLWLAEAGDLIVTPCRPCEAFVRYALGVLQLDPSVIQFMTTLGASTNLLARDILGSTLISDLQWFCQSRPNAELLCYALDAPTLELAVRLGICPTGYTRLPGAVTMNTIYNLNTKSGFRAVARKLDLPVPDGETCIGIDELRIAISKLLRRHRRVLIKLDRSSNAYANTTVAAADGPESVAQALERQIARCCGQPDDFVVEQCVDVVSSPSLELTVGETGVTTDYFCVQRYKNGQFSGMVADIRQLGAKPLAAMTVAGQKLGMYLHARGYRGVFDLDGVLTAEGQLLFTESNVRRTAGTFVHELVSRLAGADYAADRIWITDSLAAGPRQRFNHGLSKICAAGLKYDPHRRMGVLLTSDSVGRDGRWRYLIIAGDTAEAEAIEGALSATLASVEAASG